MTLCTVAVRRRRLSEIWMSAVCWATPMIEREMDEVPVVRSLAAGEDQAAAVLRCPCRGPAGRRRGVEFMGVVEGEDQVHEGPGQGRPWPAPGWPRCRLAPGRRAPRTASPTTTAMLAMAREQGQRQDGGRRPRPERRRPLADVVGRAGADQLEGAPTRNRRHADVPAQRQPRSASRRRRARPDSTAAISRTKDQRPVQAQPGGGFHGRDDAPVPSTASPLCVFAPAKSARLPPGHHGMFQARLLPSGRSMPMTPRAGLQVADELAAFVEDEVLPGPGIGRRRLLDAASPASSPGSRRRTGRCWRVRDDLQARIDAWHRARAGQPHDVAADRRLPARDRLSGRPSPRRSRSARATSTPRSRRMAGPQLVVPVLNARFVLNAANARWGSLYDALYGTDALGDAAARPGGYDAARGAAVVARGQGLPRRGGAAGRAARWAELGDPRGGHRARATRRSTSARSERGAAVPQQRPAYRGGVRSATIRSGATIRRASPTSCSKSALTTIVDLEDSVAAVDAEDKVAAYRNWLGLMRGDLERQLRQGRADADPRRWRRTATITAPDGIDRDPAGPQPAVRAQRRPSDDHPGDPAAGRDRGARGHPGRDRHQR